MEEILDSKGLRKMVCSTTGYSLSMVPATLLLRLSDPSQQHRESDLVAGRYSPHGMSDCRGELSALFRSLKRVGAFALKLCIATNIFSADPASLEENSVLLAGPWPHVLDSVRGCSSAQPIEGAAEPSADCYLVWLRFIGSAALWR